MRRLAGLLILLLLASCGGSPPPPHDYAPLNYSYLTPLRLNVGSISIDDSWTPRAGVRDVSSLSPVQPVDALRDMAQQRLVAAGSGGARAVFRIDDASIRQRGDLFDGHLGVTLDIITADDVRAAYAQARVARSQSGGGTSPEDVRQTLYSMTKQMMDDMNVEFEYQLKRSLHDWLIEDAPPSSAIPAPVEAQPLDVPQK